MEEKIFNKVYENFLAKEKFLSEYACPSKEAIRFKNIEKDMRPPFYRDIDRIIHSLSYTRYIDKTQVFSFKENDHISKRMVHVQLVSKVARTIGRALGLNEDLIEAIALGHDIGHTPIGHQGEFILDELSQKYLNERFSHNLQSVRTLMYVENNGEGCNLSIQVLDGIMCHNGEMPSNIYEPKKKTKEEFLEEYNEAYVDSVILKKLCPMTLEGCVVRISDIIAYLGRDIEDAIQIGMLKRSDIPKDITKVLGDNNHDIVNNLITDVIINSLDKPYIKMSNEVFNALFKLKKFNSDNIYKKANTKEELDLYKKKIYHLFDEYMNDIKNDNKDSLIYKVFINKMSKKYLESNKPERIIIDFISGMTDEYFINLK